MMLGLSVANPIAGIENRTRATSVNARFMASLCKNSFDSANWHSIEHYTCLLIKRELSAEELFVWGFPILVFFNNSAKLRLDDKRVTISHSSGVKNSGLARRVLLDRELAYNHVDTARRSPLDNQRETSPQT